MRLARAAAIALWAASSCLLPGFPTPQGQPTIKRLILKDGSHEPIIQYEIRGDRVRFLSADRHEWEEMPDSMVDWPATRKYAADSAEAREGLLTKAATEDSGPPLAAPGLRLPAEGGVFLLDFFQGLPELVGLSQSGADVNKNTARNILRAAVNPVAGPKQTIELKGPHALVQAHVTEPAIYLSLDTGNDPASEPSPASTPDQYRIVRCEAKKDGRVVGMIDIAIYGKVRQRANEIGTKTETVAGSWLKITPDAPLQPGEYALVEMLGEKGMNQFVWDFGVNPNAPGNPDARKPEAAKGPPVLLKKAKKP